MVRVSIDVGQLRTVPTLKTSKSTAATKRGLVQGSAMGVGAGVPTLGATPRWRPRSRTPPTP